MSDVSIGTFIVKMKQSLHDRLMNAVPTKEEFPGRDETEYVSFEEEVIYQGVCNDGRITG